jgi:hypothetical protein
VEETEVEVEGEAGDLEVVVEVVVSRSLWIWPASSVFSMFLGGGGMRGGKAVYVEPHRHKGKWKVIH